GEECLRFFCGFFAAPRKIARLPLDGSRARRLALRTASRSEHGGSGMEVIMAGQISVLTNGSPRKATPHQRRGAGGFVGFGNESPQTGDTARKRWRELEPRRYGTSDAYPRRSRRFRHARQVGRPPDSALQSSRTPQGARAVRRVSAA